MIGKKNKKKQEAASRNAQNNTFNNVEPVSVEPLTVANQTKDYAAPLLP